MPRTPDMPCAECGHLMWRSATSLPEGQAVCHPCRRKTPAYLERKQQLAKPKRPLVDSECPICGAVFHQERSNQVYCSAVCRNSRRPNWTPHVASASERGYGKEHREERARWKPIVDAGQAYCCLCHHWIEPGTKWHLDHTPDRTAYRGVAHFGCNTKDGASRGARRANANRAKIQKACPTCGSWFATPYPKQTYCSVTCRPSRKAQPKRQAPPRYCLECGVEVKGRKRCVSCAQRYARTYMRNRYRVSVGIPTTAPLYTRRSA